MRFWGGGLALGGVPLDSHDMSPFNGDDLPIRIPKVDPCKVGDCDF